jgi:hypothetical protein
MFELDEVIDHFRKLDLKAQTDYQTVTMDDLDRIDWLIEQAKKLAVYNETLKYLKECYVCNGTGQSDHGVELWQSHQCGKCYGLGKIPRE